MRSPTSAELSRRIHRHQLRVTDRGRLAMLDEVLEGRQRPLGGLIDPAPEERLEQAPDHAAFELDLGLACEQRPTALRLHRPLVLRGCNQRDTRTFVGEGAPSSQASQCSLIVIPPRSLQVRSAPTPCETGPCSVHPPRRLTRARCPRGARAAPRPDAQGRRCRPIGAPRSCELYSSSQGQKVITA